MRTYAGVILVDPDGRIALQERDDRPDVVNPGRVTTFGGLAERAETPVAPPAANCTKNWASP